MSAFGAKTTKPTEFFGNGNWLCCLQRNIVHTSGAKTLVECEDRADGTIAVTGKRSALKATQTYTQQFGQAVFDSWAQAGDAIGDVWDVDEPDRLEPGVQVWETAYLHLVLQFLQDELAGRRVV